MAIIRHWGITVDTEKPVTGVINNGEPEFLNDAMFDHNAIDLAWQEHCEECKGLCANCRCNHDGDKCGCKHYGLDDGVPLDHEYDPMEDEHDGCGPDERGDLLIGSWKKDPATGLYEPDPDAPGAEYAAIVREIYTQVVWSKTVVRVRSLCSPCYPGQANVDHDKIVTEGGYLAYDLPADMYGDKD